MKAILSILVHMEMDDVAAWHCGYVRDEIGFREFEKKGKASMEQLHLHREL